MRGGGSERRYEVAIFDFDGTLADSFPWFCAMISGVADKYGFRRVDEAEGEELRRCSSREILRRLEIPVWKVPMIAAHVRRLKAADATNIPLFEGAADLLAGLGERGVKAAIVSSDAESNIRRTLGAEASRAIARFDCGSSLFGKGQKLRRTLDALSVDPASAIYVGDELRDAEAARDVGMAFGAVAWGYAHPEALRAASPDHMFQSFAELAVALGAPPASDR